MVSMENLYSPNNIPEEWKKRWEREYKQTYPDRDEVVEIKAFVRVLIAMGINVRDESHKILSDEILEKWDKEITGNILGFMNLGVKLKIVAGLEQKQEGKQQ